MDVEDLGEESSSTPKPKVTKFVNKKLPKPKKEKKPKQKAAAPALSEEESDDDDDEEIPEGDTNQEMLNPSLRSSLTKQGYRLLGSHSGVKLCRWYFLPLLLSLT